ncbi:1-(5-phosphoribosyl)-5-[(5-phosphoribosylamino)methylideneamino]imidazole-4-carboxamide isomerase [Aliifodinibius sp. S!AR15-10]|uniref:1-(5-phosphoribosyl)-5-[(5- phosphoribosylamino)methylideneamino]imidazole-4- carboxamide isomerase n=1 Tax=Aliifodinibius sp. S!AR15-10 TaxID=2950437 RepID=UPI0028617451|nr:1-(5-phosphoribosyl)-5-[(5-phosphoribosylamino)methylideneamino]imidazole-4-carboxamide isomerase [Aliifodinibius sp. S!AR15-10]MDR8392294.1 1-(5-phosphoribosyl)-5-[(5-phosphoribosylamino)methylideneamino]imidazole-4-carboxamide isomerase [Aliifodinibius sp. S!AR15-10]
MKVIPAIDLLDGQVVRLHKGDYDQATIYNDNPVEEARKFKEAGFSHIHVIDLNGARQGEFMNLKHITAIIEETGLSVQTGGGVRSYEDADMLLKQGISKVICSSMAVRKPEDWLKLLDERGERAILGMDLKDGKVAYAGWEETSDDSLDTFLEPMLKRGLQNVLCTDISRDGTLGGPNIELYNSLRKQFPNLTFIASGGVGSYNDLLDLQKAGMPSVVVGRAYYEGKIGLEALAEFA